MTTLYEQINTRKIVLPPELQEFFSTIYDTSKKYEFVYLGKNLAWKLLIASRSRTGASPNLLSGNEVLLPGRTHHQIIKNK
jgi:hypothetical protein